MYEKGGKLSNDHCISSVSFFVQRIYALRLVHFIFELYIYWIVQFSIFFVILHMLLVIIYDCFGKEFFVDVLYSVNAQSL